MNMVRIFLFVGLLINSNYVRAEVTSFSILPSVTDPAIKTFDQPHWIYVNREIIVDQKQELTHDRHELLLWLTGTGGKGHDAQAFSELAANLGYHVVTLMYPDEIPASVCGNDVDPRSFTEFRLSIIRGGRSKHITVERSESIENRLSKLLLHLKAIRPKENWEQFLNADNTIRWEKIAVAGQSQGGGHAALIGIIHKVSRVICTGAPKDFSKKHNLPASWYNLPSATPKDRFFAFNHIQDPLGCSPSELQANLNSLNMDNFGQPVDVSSNSLPYHHTRILTTSFPKIIETGEKVTPDGKNSDWAKTAHTSVISDRNTDRWKDVWTYMLTETAPSL